MPEHPPYIQHAAEKLTEYRGSSRTVHSHASKYDQDIVKDNVENAGYQQKIKGMSGVSGRSHYTCGIIIEDTGRYSGKQDPDIRQISILYQPLVLILPKTGKYSDISSESPQSICSAPFVSYRSDYPMYRQISALFARYDLSPQITHFAYSEDAIEQLVAQNLGISIVAETESLELYDNIQVLRPSWLNDGRYLYLTYHTLRHQGNGVKEMISYIRKTFVKD